MVSMQPTLGIHFLTRSLHDTRKWVFWGWVQTAHFKNIKKEKHRQILGIHSLTRGLQCPSGCFVMVQTDKQKNMDMETL